MGNDITIHLDTESVTIPVARYNKLIRAEHKLAALEAAGVDNWDGYDDAVEELNNKENDDE